MITSTSKAVAGVGIDLIQVSRIQGVFDRYGIRFANRILGPEEQVVFKRRYQRDPHRGILYLATRFAAKEAFSKAIGLGMQSPMTWSRMQTLNVVGGRPVVRLAEPLRSWFEHRFSCAHVSVTDERDMVAAFIVVETL